MHLEEIRVRFELGWKNGQPPRLEALLDEVPEELRPGLLRRLLTIERDYRLLANQPLSLDEARRRFSDQGVWVENLLGKLGLTDAEPGLTLEVVAGPEVGRSMSLSGQSTLLVGRGGPGVQFPLPRDQHLSGVHFSISWNPPVAWLTDMKSRNGTRVNGRKAEQSDLLDGDQIEAGKTVLRVVISDTTPPELSDSAGASSGEETLVAVPDGPVVPGYALEVLLGEGGMGEVYRARRISDGLLVAIKTIQPAASSRGAMVARFEREMVILQRLTHPGIVHHLHSGESGGLLYFVMEYVEGTDAYRVVKKHGPMDEERVMRLACQLLDALDHAHAQGVIHRDIKPANLLLSGAGQHEIVKLADFGLARTYQESLSELTLAGESGGSPGFMAPEQVMDLRTARPTADQYGVAATLYFLLTGKTVTEPGGGPVEMLLRNVQPAPIPARAGGDSALRDRLAEVIRRALAWRPEDRYEDVRAMRAALAGGP